MPPIERVPTSAGSSFQPISIRVTCQSSEQKKKTDSKSILIINHNTWNVGKKKKKKKKEIYDQGEARSPKLLRTRLLRQRSWIWLSYSRSIEATVSCSSHWRLVYDHMFRRASVLITISVTASRFLIFYLSHWRHTQSASDITFPAEVGVPRSPTPLVSYWRKYVCAAE